MKPTATYRIQLNDEFNFNNLKEILPYLSQLGISHIYASPIAQARHGSKHGYDTLDPSRVSEELGGSETLRALLKEAQALGLGWIQDIVPNHIAYSPESPVVSDLMKHGDNSACYSYLDIDWNHPDPRLSGKVLAPFLDGDLKENLQAGRIRLAWHGWFMVKYGEMEFPIKINSCKEMLSDAFKKLPWQTWNESTFLATLQNLYDSDKDARDAIDHEVSRYNRNADLLNKLLSNQVYVLDNWKTAYSEIDYRRFFDISDLICLRMEKEDVFESTHRLVQWLVSDCKVDGLRVDHVDGLHDPEEYLRRLRKLAPEVFVVVEKILLNDESLPTNWGVQGTTGYDFLNQLNGLFIAAGNEAEINQVYRSFTGNKETLDDILYGCKKLVIRKLFRGDVENLARGLREIMREATGEKLTKKMGFEVVAELLAAYSVYRTYINTKRADDKDKRILKAALETARRRNPKLEKELAALEKLLLLSTLPDSVKAWVMRLQQYTGPAMAKGFEDTTFYRFNRLLSLNEVGGNPVNFGFKTADFHTSMKSRQAACPLSLSASSTHDTKRGEDCRARINVLSETPVEFKKHLKRWAAINLEKKRKIGRRLAPNRNEEYYIYQTLLGSFPFDASEIQGFAERLRLHIVKALREAKTNSSWLSSNLDYEDVTTAFASHLLDTGDGNLFLREFLPFQRKIAFYGVFNSLSQTLIKIASPGTPDFYQGSELWDLSMVDPDNRRPVDFAKRRRLLSELQKLDRSNLRGLLNDFGDGKAKLYLISRALNARKSKSDVFHEGAYVPLKVEGVYKNNIVAFCRKKKEDYAVAVVPRFIATVTHGQEELLPLGDFWKETAVRLPEGAPRVWTEVFSGETFSSRQTSSGYGLRVADALNIFPAALFVSGEHSA